MEPLSVFREPVLLDFFIKDRLFKHDLISKELDPGKLRMAVQGSDAYVQVLGSLLAGK